ncbi:multicopper oxidase-domain-containing protein [Clohesyomyces aquaticus]|uniref:Multicopper oxidase-domain-containing protein n=1 Tax=Clohesyomyces aquaticus TaxID=1231657 RepID=A0A1Y1YHA8_9PLEO|nr:multicopper oxidase-domain-containing protein [Clohesyomyces aquaticus]
MGFISHSLAAFLVLAGTTPLVSGRSLPPRNTLVPRGASPGFNCEFPQNWKPCNNDTNRDCWVIDPNGKRYDINTDYERDTPPGIERPYSIEIDESPFSPDGTVKPLAKLIDKKFPGTLIEACWGDTLIVNVKNKLPDNGTTIHWHGVRLLGSNEMDGVNGVTQCPVAQDDSFTYKFKLTQYGHSWYHSHYSTQYGDGVAGPLLIHGPNSANWDYEWTPLLVSDWLHDSAFAAFHNELVGPPLPMADTILLNGTGHFNGSGSYFNQTFVAGKRYLIRIINASVGLHFHFSIDNHILQVISTDFVPIKPYNTTSLSIGIGQRYSVIVEAKPDTPSSNGKYWIRTEYSTACNNPINDILATNLDRQRTGIICYGNSTNSTDLPTSTRTDVAAGCADVPTASLQPIVPWTIGAPQNNITNNTYHTGLHLGQPFRGNVLRWDITDTPMFLNFSNPTLFNTKNTTWDPEYAVVDYNYTDGENGDKFVYMVITSGSLKGATPAKVPAWHPIHLHGHDFAILAQSSNPWDPVTGPNSFQPINATRRDVAGLPNGGYLAIAFKPDNPGAWLLHCHIAWHASSGLALQILERQNEILLKNGPLDQQRAGCAKWDEWNAIHKVDQDDSGI